MSDVIRRKPRTTQTTHEQTQPQAQADVPTKRQFQTQKSFMHDLYKLEVSHFLQNQAIDGHEPDYVKTEHVHYFHTIDSNGKEQTKSNSVGGHFHKIEVIEQGPDLPPIVKCASGPMKEVKVKIMGKYKTQYVPANDVDSHTHDVTYLKSNVITERIRNAEAAKVEAALQSKAQPLPGAEISDT
jgi:hypothetical protein